jgi:hypothetical protein
LFSALDGTFVTDNSLASGDTYVLLNDAALCLHAIVLDGQTQAAERDQAWQAREFVVLAARILAQALIDGSALFGNAIPQAASDALQRARGSLSAGDQAYANQQVAQAIDHYSAAWTEAKGAVDMLWATFDPDADRLLDQFELTLGTDVTRGDTDGDGITDGDEFLVTGGNPIQADAQDDRDGDGLTAAEELAARTSALQHDTDDDSLDDRFELATFNSNPTIQDTDSDGLNDDSEYRLGSNPRVADGDGDGIPDGQEVYQTLVQHDSGNFAVQMLGIGDLAATTNVRPLSFHPLFHNLPGQMGAAVDITTEQPFIRARVRIKFDAAQVPNNDSSNLRILYFDETAGTFLPTDGAHGITTIGGDTFAWADTSHFTTFALFYIPNWDSVWTSRMEPGRDETDPVAKNVDVMLVIDESNSMRTNDPQRLRVDAAKNFVNALIPNDRAGVIGFAYSSRMLQPLTSNLPLTLSALDGIVDNRNDTCVYQGLSQAYNHLRMNGNSNHSRLQIIITDGEDTLNCGWSRESYAALAAGSGQQNIPIYTIGLGSSVDVGLLQELAGLSGGKYYNISTANDLPNVFRQIIEEPDPTADADGDGLLDWLEREGIRLGTGRVVATNPSQFDTDGDGLSDGEEVGNLKTGSQGDYYDGITDPLRADTDSDGLTDGEEVYTLTNPTDFNTDSDGMNDYWEVTEGFDPTHPNPDGDSFEDREEYDRGSDPFTYDLDAWEYGAAVVAGFVLGDAGQNMVNLGLLPSAHLQSFGYIAGWLASGFFVIGDIRDTLAALVQGDITDTFLNAIGLIPLLGDASKVVRVVTKYLEWLPDARIALYTWLKKQFAGAPAVLDEVVGTVFKLCNNSFSGDTLVHTPRGVKPIASLQKNDQVLAYHEGLGRTGIYTVTATFSHIHSVIVKLTMGDETIQTTQEHPFFVQRQGWVEAEDVRPGMRVYQADGEYGVVEQVEVGQRSQRMYNLSVAEAETFFVGEEAWLVHNTNCPTFDEKLIKRISSILSRYPLTSPIAGKGGKCDICARKIYDLLIQNGYTAQIGRMNTNLPRITTVDNRLVSIAQGNSPAYHEFVRVGDVIFDAITGSPGMTWDQYTKLFYDDVFTDGTITITYSAP